MIRRHQDHRPEWLFPYSDPEDLAAGLWAGPLSPEPTIVQGFDLTGTMVHLAAPGARRTAFSEPSAIDPTLPLSGNTQNAFPAYYARSYHDLAPDQRRDYLAWLAGGRRDQDVDRAFMRLYLNGLERRVLVDLANDPRVEAELPAIMAEIIALRETYGSRMAAGFGDGLLQILTILMIAPGQPLPLPPIDPTDWEEPPLLRFGLGRFVVEKRPIPAEWAAMWAWYRRDIVIRSALLRTTEEFQAIFAHRYREAYGEGLTFKAGKREVTIAYSSPNPTVGPVKLPLAGIPDIFSRPAAGQKLRQLVEQVWTELGPYARAVSRTFSIDESLSMAALLPPILQSRDQPAIGEALRTLDLALGPSPTATATIPDADLVDLWWPRSWDGSPATRQLAAKDRKAFTALIGRFGYGVEPDPRYGKRPGQRASDDLVIFRTGDAVPPEPGPAWNAAVVAAQAGAAIVAQDGDLDETTAAHLATEIAAAFALHPTEVIRLQVALAALAASEEPVRLSGLKAFIDPLYGADRARIGSLAIEVAARQGTVSPAVVTLVQKIARLLDLDVAEVPSRLFGALTRDLAAPESRRRPAKAASQPFALDHTAIAATQAATAAVSDLLGELLQEADIRDTPSPRAEDRVAGLDAPHAAMLRAIAASGEMGWTTDALDALAQAHHLLGAGAIDVLNDAALDVADEPLLADGEEDDAFILDRDVLALLLAAPAALAGEERGS